MNSALNPRQRAASSRRSFLKHNAVLVCGLMMGRSAPVSWERRKFRMCLNGGAIGVNYDQSKLLDAAITHQYEAVVSLPSDLAKMNSAEKQALLEKMQANNITWGSGGLPIDFRKDEVTFAGGLRELPLAASALESVQATRMNTWIMPSNPNYTYNENFKMHKRRLKAVANILGHHGIRLGLEYVGPKTLLTRSKYSFIRTMSEAKELIAAIDESNVGLVLDSFHWYCAGDTQADLLTLENDDIITVDLNDARDNLTPDTQIDGKRELPMATGVIPIQEFMDALVKIGYDGPVRAEPFNQALRDMDDERAIEATHLAMRKAFDLVG